MVFQVCLSNTPGSFIYKPKPVTHPANLWNGVPGSHHVKTLCSKDLKRAVRILPGSDNII